MGLSEAQRFARLPAAERSKVLARLSDAEIEHLAYDWPFWGRPEQQTPVGAWRVWLALAGRGWGKTRVGSEWIREQVDAGRNRIALVGATAADVRDVMIEGDSGLLAVFPPHQRPVYEPSKRKVTFHTGAFAMCYSAEEPERLRGPQHECGWADEVAAWQYEEAWHQLQFGMRLGPDPRICATTTPKPKKIIRDLVKRKTTHVTSGSTYDNADNLAEAFLEVILDEYEGTSLGRQELHAQILDEVAGALLTREVIDKHRVERLPSGLEVVRSVIGVDPAITAKKASNKTGLVVALLADNGHAYITTDLTAVLSPNAWGSRVVDAYHDLELDKVIAEGNQGGDMVAQVIAGVDPDVPVKIVHARNGKYARAEPIAAKYEQGRVHHVGVHEELEAQWCTWLAESGESPDNLDAAVWALSELFPKRMRRRQFRSLAGGDEDAAEDERAA